MRTTAPMYFAEKHCGYCHGANQSMANPSSRTMGFTVGGLSLEEYDQLINLGFRRSGNFVYKVDPLRACCKMYAIRTSWGLMKLSKEHKRDVKKLVKAIGGDASLPTDVALDELDTMAGLRIILESNKYTREKYDLFRKYQTVIHNDDDTSVGGFKRFLCDSPLPSSVSQSTGSLHQCYYLNDKLIAIGVLDILPSGISSVYFIYDPDLKHLVLGKVSGLNEMRLTKRLGLPWYYLGYYIQDCVKMKYKARFGGELLNPYDNEFVPIHDLPGFWCLKDGVNVARETFGLPQGTAHRRNKDKTDSKMMELGLEYPDDSNDVIQFPRVIPGVMPLEEALEHTGTLLKAEVNGKVLDLPFMALSPPFKQIYIDLMRLLGVDLFGRTTLVLNY